MIKRKMSKSTSNEIQTFLRQLFVATGAAVNIIGHGCVHGYPAVLLTQLQRHQENHTVDYNGSYKTDKENASHGGEEYNVEERMESEIFVTDEAASWITSVVGVALLFGTITVPYIMNRYGRKTAHQLGTLPIIFGWILIVFAQNTWTLIAARLLQGYAIGLRAPVAAIIIAEYTSPKYRGAFLGSIALSLALGMFISHVLGTIMTWRMTALACLTFSLLALIMITFSPESPSWLASKGRFDEAVKSFIWLRGSSDKRELDILIKTQKSDLENKMNSCENKQKTNLVTIFIKKEFYKPLIVSYCLFTIFEFGGTHIVPAYAYDIMKVVLFNETDSKIAVGLIDIIRIAAAMLSFGLVSYLNRRVVLFSSICSTIFAYLLISLYIFLKSSAVLSISSNIFPIALFMFYIFSLTIGIIPMTWTLNGEIFPLADKTLGSTLSCLFLSLNYFISLKTAPFLFRTVGVDGAYLVYSGILVLCGILLYFILPETKDKILQEIEYEFRGIDIRQVELVAAERDIHFDNVSDKAHL